MTRLDWDKARTHRRSPAPPTKKQIQLLARLGVTSVPQTKQQASRIISKNIVSAK